MIIDFLLNLLTIVSAMSSIIFLVLSRGIQRLPDTWNGIAPAKLIIGSAFLGVASFAAFTGMLRKIDSGISTQVTEVAAVFPFLAVIATFASIANSYRVTYTAFRNLIQKQELEKGIENLRQGSAR